VPIKIHISVFRLGCPEIEVQVSSGTADMREQHLKNLKLIGMRTAIPGDAPRLQGNAGDSKDHVLFPLESHAVVGNRHPTCPNSRFFA
jgi:biotin synthase-like enzyme